MSQIAPGSLMWPLKLLANKSVQFGTAIDIGVYVSNRLTKVFPKAFWSAKDDERVIRAQIDRRASILKFNQSALRQLTQRR